MGMYDCLVPKGVIIWWINWNDNEMCDYNRKVWLVLGGHFSPPLHGWT